MLKWLAGIASDLQTLEADAAPAGWKCLWNRYAAVVFTISNPVAVHLILIHSSTNTKPHTNTTNTTTLYVNLTVFNVHRHHLYVIYLRMSSLFHFLPFVSNKMYLQKVQSAAIILGQSISLSILHFIIFIHCQAVYRVAYYFCL